MKMLTFTNVRKRALFDAFILLASLSFTVASSLLILVNSKKFPIAVPFWFSKPWGEGWLAEPNYLWLIPTISFTVILVNFILFKLLESEEKIIYLLLTGSSLIVSILFFYTLLEIIFVAT